MRGPGRTAPEPHRAVTDVRRGPRTAGTRRTEPIRTGRPGPGGVSRRARFRESPCVAPQGGSHPAGDLSQVKAGDQDVGGGPERVPGREAPGACLRSHPARPASPGTPATPRPGSKRPCRRGSSPPGMRWLHAACQPACQPALRGFGAGFVVGGAAVCLAGGEGASRLVAGDWAAVPRTRRPPWTVVTSAPGPRRTASNTAVHEVRAGFRRGHDRVRPAGHHLVLALAPAEGVAKGPVGQVFELRSTRTLKDKLRTAGRTPPRGPCAAGSAVPVRRAPSTRRPPRSVRTESAAPRPCPGR